MKAASIACCLLMLVVTANSVAVYRDAFYKTRTIPNVPYVKTLVACTDQTDQATCQETEMVLDVWMPTNTTAGPFPIVMSVHGGGFVSGDQKVPDPPNAYFAERGFVTFAVQYRLAKDKGLYPKPLKRWSPKTAEPHGDWTPWVWQMYPAVRDIKAALRWIHAHAAEYHADPSSITLQGGSAGATAVMELALTGGDRTFEEDYTGELQGLDRTLSTANLDQPTTVTGLIDYWGGIFAVDLMHFADGKPRWSSSSVPTVAFHGTVDTTVSPETGDILCGNLTALGVKCKKVSLPGQKHACWNAEVTLPSGEKQSIFDYAFVTMAQMQNWTLIGPPPGSCAASFKKCGGVNWTGPACCDGQCTCEGNAYFKSCRPPSGQHTC